MNPELSLAATASLPRERANAKARRNVSSDVVTARTTSTSGISGTGLKKCRPTKRSARLVGAALFPPPQPAAPLRGLHIPNPLPPTPHRRSGDPPSEKQIPSKIRRRHLPYKKNN